MRHVLVLLLLLAACVPEKTDRESETKRVDEAALAFERWVLRHYEARLAKERGLPAPSNAVQLRAREELKEALAALDLELPDGEALKGAFDSVREVLVAHDYVFLPLSQGGEDSSEDLGIAFAHVRRREPARSLELWGKKVEFKLIVYEPLVYDYPTWRDRTLKAATVLYSPGRFSVERQTIYVDHSYCVKRAQALPPETQTLGLEGVEREVVLRQAAYLAFAHEPHGEDLSRWHEKVFWTVVRYGDPDLAWVDVLGIAASEDRRHPEPLRAAAARVRMKLPETLDGLSKEERGRVLRKAAEEAWKLLG